MLKFVGKGQWLTVISSNAMGMQNYACMYVYTHSYTYIYIHKCTYILLHMFKGYMHARESPTATLIRV